MKKLTGVISIALIMMLLAGCSGKEAPEQTNQTETIPEATSESTTEASESVESSSNQDDAVFEWFEMDEESMETKMGQWNEKTGYLGGDWYRYDLYTFGFGTIDGVHAMQSIVLREGVSFLGLTVGDSLEDVHHVLGSPETEYLFTDESGESEQIEGYYTEYKIEGFLVQFYSETQDAPTLYVQISRVNDSSNHDVSIEPVAAGLDYYQFSANQQILFDLNEDGVNEEIYFDTTDFMQCTLSISGYHPVVEEGINLETTYFSVVKYHDPYSSDFDFYAIGILDYGPSSDLVTKLYAVVPTPMGDEAFVSVGSIGGMLVDRDVYDMSDEVKFNEFAFSQEANGLNVPVRLSLLPITWYGRNDFVYHTTNMRLMDQGEDRGELYETNISSKIAEDVMVYGERDKSAATKVILGGQELNFIETDNVEWIFVTAEDGAMGWLHKDDVDFEIFTDMTLYMYD